MLNRLDLRALRGPALVDALPRPDPGGEGPTAAVAAIVDDVARRGDAAVRELTARLDGVDLDTHVVPSEELQAALESIDPDLRRALTRAAEAVRAFHEGQRRPEHRSERDGIVVTGRTVPVRRAGCYVPGGRGSYPSSVLMTVIPAKVAGVDRVVLCVPPDRATGRIAASTLAAAAIAGADEVHAIGGAQAIAAMAHGTETLEPVDVIVGPGNVYVALAKRAVADRVGVPMAFAGPSEIVVVADGTAPVDFVAIDLMVQAEHGPDGLAWLVTWSPEVADAVDAALARLVADAPRADAIRSTFAVGGFCALVADEQAALEVVDHVAAEHVEVMTADPAAFADRIRNGGAVFLGPLSPASIGDYVAGPSHVLPTFGSARFASALGVDDFTKAVHVIEVTADGFDPAAEVVAAIADAEGFSTHAESVRLRRRALGDRP